MAKIERQGGNMRLIGEATIYEVDTLRESLRTVPLGGDRVEIDLSTMTELDGAGAQTLAAFKRTFREVVYINCPPRIRERLRWAGMDQVLLT